MTTEKRRDRMRLGWVIALIAGVGFLHYSCQFYLVEHTQLHNVFHKLFYVPILLAAYWWGVRGGAWAGFACAAIYLIDVIRFWSPENPNHYNKIGELLLFLLVGILLGALVDSDRRSRIAKQKAEQRAEEEYLRSITDPLTKAFNRRFLERKLHEIWEWAHREGRTFSLLMIDLNKFKEINDQWGHPAGDKVLQTTVQTIFNNVRKNDPVFRYGGDEFLILLPDTPASAALKLAERLREEMAKLSFKGPAKESFQADFSIGIIEFKPDLQDVHEMLSKLDAALYRAKKEDRKIALAG